MRLSWGARRTVALLKWMVAKNLSLATVFCNSKTDGIGTRLLFVLADIFLIFAH